MYFRFADDVIFAHMPRLLDVAASCSAVHTQFVLLLSLVQSLVSDL